MTGGKTTPYLTSGSAQIQNGQFLAKWAISGQKGAKWATFGQLLGEMGMINRVMA